MDSSPPGRGTVATLAAVLLLFAVGILGATGVASAASTVYVDAGAGDSACPVTSYATIQDAVDDASAGDTIVVCDGRYTETVTVDKTLSLVAADGSEVVLDGRTLPAGSTAITVESTAAGTVVEGFRATGFGEVVNLSNVGDAAVRDLLANESDAGVVVSASGTATVSNVTVRNVTLDGVSTGVLVTTDDDAELSDVNVFRNVLNGSDTGVLVDGGSSVPVESVGVRQNLLANATTAGVRTTGSTDVTGVRVTRNFLRDNAPYGIENENASGTLTAWLNHWGDASGPGSLGATVTDPVTGTRADGSGDNVSANVNFDPWIGKGACVDPQLRNATDRTVEFFGGEIRLSQLQPTCIWERAALPFRADDDDAATSARNLQLFVRTGSGDVPANRPRLSVYQQGNDLTLRFESTSGADVSRFAGDDTQLLVVRGEGTSTDFEAGLDNSTGEGTLTVDDASVSVRDTPALDADGELSYTLTPAAAGDYTFVLVTNDFGPGVEAGGPGEVRIDGGVTVAGVESVPVHNENASANTTATSYTAGSNVSFDLDSNLADARTNHTVLLYNESRFVDATMVAEVDGNLSDVLTGDLSSTDVTVEHSIRSLNGFIRADVGVSALGYEVAAQNRSGRIDPSPLVDSTAGQFGLGDQVTTTTTGDATLLNGSVVAVRSGISDTTVDVETFRNFSAGTYRWVYVAQRGSAVSSDAGTVQITTPTPTPTPTATPSGGGGGGGDGGGGLPGGGGDGEVEIEAADLLNATVTTGRDAVVRVDLANVDPARGRIALDLTADGEVVAERTAAVGSSRRRTVYVRAAFDEPGTYDLALNGIDLGTVTVADTPGTPGGTPTRTPGGGVTPTPGDTPEVTDTPGTPTDPGQTPPGPAGPTGSEIVLAFGLVLGLLAAVGIAVYVIPGSLT